MSYDLLMLQVFDRISYSRLDDTDPLFVADKESPLIDNDKDGEFVETNCCPLDVRRINALFDNKDDNFVAAKCCPLDVRRIKRKYNKKPRYNEAPSKPTTSKTSTKDIEDDLKAKFFALDADSTQNTCTESTTEGWNSFSDGFNSSYGSMLSRNDIFVDTLLDDDDYVNFDDDDDDDSSFWQKSVTSNYSGNVSTIFESSSVFSEVSKKTEQPQWIDADFWTQGILANERNFRTRKRLFNGSVRMEL